MEFNQRSFSGGMNLVVDDTRLSGTQDIVGGNTSINVNQYREAFNVRNRFDVLDSIPLPTELSAPAGNKQGIWTFGDYVLLFVAGNAYYQHRTLTGWTKIQNFSMDPFVSRMYIETVPLSTTLYARKLPSSGSSGDKPIQTPPLTSGGTPAGVIVQDGLNQPQFIWIDGNGIVQCRVTQKFSEWKYDPTDEDDRREYVPIGTLMTFYDGILFVLAPDNITLYRSCSGRPLDFVLNIDIAGNAGGDATTTAYSVGTGPITCIRVMNGVDGMFVSAANEFCYQVSINRTPGAPILYGEPTFIRTFLFVAGCMNNVSFMDILGDSAFIDLDGIRSFNAVVQLQN